MQILDATSRLNWRSPSHHALLAGLYFVGLELLVAFYQWIWVLTGVLLGLMALGMVLVRFEEQADFQTKNVVLPLLATVGLTGFIIFMPSGTARHLYIAAAAVVVFWLLQHASRAAYPTWNWVLMSVVLLLNTSVILGFYNHQYWPAELALILFFVTVWLLTAQGVSRVVQGKSRTMLVTSVIALVMTQLLWTLLFLPLTFLVQAAIVTTAFYVTFHLVSLSYEQRLRRSVILEYVSFGAVLLIVLLTTAHWF